MGNSFCVEIPQSLYHFHCHMINYIVESFAVVIVNLQQEIRKRTDTQIVDAKQLEVKVNIFKHYRQRLTAHSKQFYNVGVQKSIEKSYFFEEKFLLALVKDMQHFLGLS